MVTVAATEWQTLTPEQLGQGWVKMLIADGHMKTVGGKTHEVLEFFARYFIQYGEASVYPSQQRIMQETGCSRSTVARATRGLQSAGIIRKRTAHPVIDKASGQFVRRETTRYRLCERGKEPWRFRKDDYRRNLRKACQRTPKPSSVTYVSNLAQGTSSKGVNTHTGAVGPAQWPPTEEIVAPPPRDLARYIEAGRAERTHI